MAVKIKKSKQIEKLGEWSFIVGLLLAIVIGLVQGTRPEAVSISTIAETSITVATLLVALGAIVGLINIRRESTQAFLVAAIALLVAGGAGLQNIPALGTYLVPVLINITTFVAPAAAIVAIKAVYALG